MSARRFGGLTPWDAAALRLFLAGTAVGAVLIAAGWSGASTTARFRDQIVWINVGVIGITVAVAAEVLWLLKGRRAVGILRRALIADAPPPAAGAPDNAGAVVTVAGTLRIHRSYCLLVAGKRTVETDTSGGSPCEICRPLNGDAATR